MPHMATETPLMMTESPCQTQRLHWPTDIKDKGILQALKALCIVTRKCSSVTSPVLEIELLNSRRSEQDHKMKLKKGHQSALDQR